MPFLMKTLKTAAIFMFQIAMWIFDSSSSMWQVIKAKINYLKYLNEIVPLGFQLLHINAQETGNCREL